MKKKVSSENVVKDIRRQTRRKYSSEEKVRIVLEVFVGKTVFIVCVSAKVFCLISITVGVKIF